MKKLIILSVLLSGCATGPDEKRDNTALWVVGGLVVTGILISQGDSSPKAQQCDTFIHCNSAGQCSSVNRCD